MAALTNLWNSEKGVFGIALIIACTVLTALGKVSAADWMTYT